MLPGPQGKAAFLGGEEWHRLNERETPPDCRDRHWLGGGDRQCFRARDGHPALLARCKGLCSHCPIAAETLPFNRVPTALRGLDTAFQSRSYYVPSRPRHPAFPLRSHLAGRTKEIKCRLMRQDCVISLVRPYLAGRSATVRCGSSPAGPAYRCSEAVGVWSSAIRTA